MRLIPRLMRSRRIIAPPFAPPYLLRTMPHLPSPRRRGFIILFGWRPINSKDGRPPVTVICPNCRQSVEMVGKSQRTWFTLFFIPVFPISGATPFVQCSSCGAAFNADLDQMHRNQAISDNSLYQRGIALYNSLRKAPADSALLNQLMDHYGGMGEFNEALSAARHFPDALESSAQCLTTLGKIQLSANMPQDAVNSFGKALAKTPGFPDALFFQGVAYLALTPPDTQRTIAVARAAQSAEIPMRPRLASQGGRDGPQRQMTRPSKHNAEHNVLRAANFFSQQRFRPTDCPPAQVSRPRVLLDAAESPVRPAHSGRRHEPRFCSSRPFPASRASCGPAGAPASSAGLPSSRRARPC